MNVAVFVHFRRLINQTGVGRVTYELLHALIRQRGIELCAIGSREDFEAIRTLGIALPSAMQIELFSRSRAAQQLLWLALKQPKCESLWKEADVVWCPAESYIPSNRIPLVVTVHDAAHMESGLWPANGAHSAHQLRWRWLFRRLESDAAAFITVSQFSADRLAFFYPWMKDRLWVVPNAVPARLLAPPSADGDRFVHNLELSNTRIVLVPGGLTHRKNGELILAAWELVRRRMHNVTLVIAGSSDEDLVARCETGSNEVRHLGYVTDEVFRSLYEKADVVWFPSRYEGFGMPVLEAMACGRPVVASASSSIPEVAGDAAILLPVDSPEHHSEAIIDLLQNLEKREDYARRGLRRAQMFSWELSADRLVNVFHQTLSKKSAADSTPKLSGFAGDASARF